MLDETTLDTFVKKLLGQVNFPMALFHFKYDYSYLQPQVGLCQLYNMPVDAKVEFARDVRDSCPLDPSEVVQIQHIHQC